MKNNMAFKALTWGDLADKISQMKPEEREETVKVLGSELQFCDNVVLTKKCEDMCWDEEYPSDGCDVRSNFDENTELSVALKANTYYLNAE